MHTRHSVRWISSVGALAVGLIGLGVPLAAPAAAAATITASPAQPRYTAATTATINVTTSVATAAANLTVGVTNGPDTRPAVPVCTSITSTQFTCPVANTVADGPGTDTVVITDTTVPTTSTTTTVSFETVTAQPGQTLYGAGETATISVLVTGATAGASITGNIAPGGADAPGLATQPISCSQVAGVGNYSCSYTNNGSAGSDVVTIFDDDNPSGTGGIHDASEPAAASFTLNFEKITATPNVSRSTTSQDAIDVTVTGIPTGHTVVLKETLVSGANDSIPNPPCIAGGAVTAGTQQWLCAVTSNGRVDSPVVKIYDDLNGDSTAAATEPQTTTTFSFETVSVSDPNAGAHLPGTTATLNVTLAGVPAGQTTSVDYNTLAGSVDPNPNVTLCQGSGTAWTCTITNTHGGGIDHLQIFDDANNNQKFDQGNGQQFEPYVNFDVNFGASVTATPVTQSVVTGGTATVAAHVTAPAGETPQLTWGVTAGPDMGIGGNCAPLNGGTTDWTCKIPNTNGSGTDTIAITDAASSEVPKPSATVKATFVTATAITLTPLLIPGQHTSEVASGGCIAYAVDVNPAAVGFPVQVTVEQDLGQATGGLLGIGATPPSEALSLCTPTGASAVSGVSHTETASGGDPILGLLDPADYVESLQFTSTTGQTASTPGRVIFGLSSTHLGGVAVVATTGNLTTGTQTFAVVAGGQSNVKALSVTPASQSVVNGGSAPFVVTAVNANGTPLPGINVKYVVAAGGPDATSTAATCPATSQFGTTTCTINAGLTLIGTDVVTFFAPQAATETAPTANDPQTTAKVFVGAAPPAGSTLTLNCPDELVTDANALVPSCTVTTGGGGSQSVIFAAHVAGPAGAALANIPVQFSVVSGPATVTSTPGNVNTNSSGNAVFVVSETNPAAGDKITVQAVVGNPQTGGLGPRQASATFQAPKPTYVTATPASQQVANGGAVNVVAKVLDQFGVGVVGQVIDYSVSGRNAASGIVTTTTGGAANVSYTDRGSAGSDTITLLDTSANAPATGNPAHATVTFGSSGGCTVNCGGCTVNCGSGVEHPTLKVHQTVLGGGVVRLSLVVLSHPKVVNAAVTF
ncbi:MAG TPA: hypothetical protein VHW74_03480, partial [Mycobacteriales bacterium]|nr:hypothetical protein [Mycobacteriales bacterium]